MEGLTCVVRDGYDASARDLRGQPLPGRKGAGKHSGQAAGSRSFSPGSGRLREVRQRRPNRGSISRRLCVRTGPAGTSALMSRDGRIEFPTGWLQVPRDLLPGSREFPGSDSRAGAGAVRRGVAIGRSPAVPGRCRVQTTVRARVSRCRQGRFDGRDGSLLLGVVPVVGRLVLFVDRVRAADIHVMPVERRFFGLDDRSRGVHVDVMTVERGLFVLTAGVLGGVDVDVVAGERGLRSGSGRGAGELSAWFAPVSVMC